MVSGGPVVPGVPDPGAEAVRPALVFEASDRESALLEETLHLVWEASVHPASEGVLHRAREAWGGLVSEGLWLQAWAA